MNVNRAGQTHDQLQAACWEWACNAYNPYIYRRLIAIPNDGIGAGIAKWKQYEAIGVTPGVWDMQLHWFQQSAAFPNIFYPATYWWEFKVGTDLLKPKQLEFQKSMRPLGHTFFVAREEYDFHGQFKSVVEPTLEHAKKILKGNIF